MNAIGIVIRQLETVNLRFHHVAKDVTPQLMIMSANTLANPVGFVMWHMARSQDWAVHTAIRGVPEIASSMPWSRMEGISMPGIGTGFSLAAARELTAQLDKSALLGYADAVHLAAVAWVRGLREAELDAIPDVATHNAGIPAYQTPGFLAQMDSGPEHDQAVGDVGGQPVWLLLTSVCVMHLHRHLGELDLTLGALTGRAG